MRPSTVPPQATFLQICGALSDFSTPRNHKILKLCSRKDSVNLTVAWCEPNPHHAHCAPRAVWAQTALVRGSFRLRTIKAPSGRGLRRKAVEESACTPFPHNRPLCAQSPFAGGQCTFFFAQKKKVPKKKLTSMLLDRFCDRQLCRPKPFFLKYAVRCLISALPEITKF